MEREIPKDQLTMSASNGVETPSPLAYARALRWAVQLGLGPKEQEHIERLIVGEPESLEVNELPRLKQIELRIRQCVEEDGSWESIEPLVWQIYQLQPGSQSAARAIELAFLYAPAEALPGVVARACELEEDCYHKIQDGIRIYLLLRLCVDDKVTLLSSSLRTLERRLPLEQLIFFMLEAKQDPNQALVFYQQFEEEINDAVEEFGHSLHLSADLFTVHVAKLAIQMEYESLARKLLAKIRKDSPQYDDAVHLLLQVHVQRDEDGLCTYGRQLKAENDWRQRLKLLYDFLAEARRLEGPAHKGRAALNELLRHPLEWVPGVPEAWAAVGNMLVANLDLEPLLPQLFEVYVDAATKFQPSPLDVALWYPCLNLQTGDQARDLFWRAIANFHLFMTGQENFQENLWDAYSLYQEAQRTTTRAFPFDWKSLQRTAIAWIAKTPALTEKRRVVMQRILRMAADPTDLTTTEILSFLDDAELPPLRVTSKLLTLARQKKDDNLLLEIIQRKARLSYYTNKELDELWGICARLNKHDLAWRVASLLHARQSLDEKVVHPWAISGENRNEYGLNPLLAEHAVLAIRDIKDEEQKFLLAVLQVGSLLPDLLAVLDDGAKIVKVAAPKAHSREAIIEKSLEHIEWMADSKRQYRFSHEKHVLGRMHVPTFVQVLPNNTWSHLMLRLGVRLGCAAWGWSVTFLHQQLEGLVPRLAQGQEARLPGKVGKWLRSLSPEQRKSWYDLITYSGRIREERGVELLGFMLMRLALIMNQNHYQAITSLHTMRAPVSMLRSLENFILSPEYSQIRRKQETNSKVPVPLALLKLPTILKP